MSAEAFYASWVRGWMGVPEPKPTTLPPRVPQGLSAEILKEIGPLPRCRHGLIYATCSTCERIEGQRNVSDQHKYHPLDKLPGSHQPPQGQRVKADKEEDYSWLQG